MVQYTRYHGWPLPEKNEREWHEPQQQTIKRIDAAIAGVSDGSVAKDEISAARKLQLPVYEDLTNYPNPIDGDIAYATGTGVYNEGVYAYDGVSWIGPFGSGDGGGGETNTLWTDLDDVAVGTLSNRPAAGTAGQWYFTTDQGNAYYDNGDTWVTAYLSPGNVSQSDLSFDAISNSELTTHTDSAGAHHTRYSDSEAQSAVRETVDAGDLAGTGGVAGEVLHTDGTSAFWASGGGSGGGTSIAEGTFTHQTASMTTTIDITEVIEDEQAQLRVTVGPDSTDQVTAPYAFNYDWSQQWDESNGWYDISLVVNWDENPGSDMQFSYNVLA